MQMIWLYYKKIKPPYNALCTDYINSVSYTHLDVYKRQLVNSNKFFNQCILSLTHVLKSILHYQRLRKTNFSYHKTIITCTCKRNLLILLINLNVSCVHTYNKILNTYLYSPIHSYLYTYTHIYYLNSPIGKVLGSLAKLK